MSIDDRGRTAGRGTIARFEASANVAQDYEELVRRRRSQRTMRAALVAAVAVGVVVAAFSARGTIQVEPAPPPVGPAPTPSASPTAEGLTRPLVAPTSLLEVPTLGFHVEPVAGFEQEGPGTAWRIDGEGHSLGLRWAQVPDAFVVVQVFYPGQHQITRTDSSSDEAVTIHGAPGVYWGVHDSASGAFEAAVDWEYAPGSWASVSAHSSWRDGLICGSRFACSAEKDAAGELLRAALLQIADAVADGGEPLRLPIRARELASALPDATLTSVGVQRGADGWSATAGFEQLSIEIGSGSARQVCEERKDLEVLENFSYRGDDGCVGGFRITDRLVPGTTMSAVRVLALQSGSTVRTALPTDGDDGWFASHYLECREVLAELTVAPLEDPSVWFDLSSTTAS